MFGTLKQKVKKLIDDKKSNIDIKSSIGTFKNFRIKLGIIIIKIPIISIINIKGEIIIPIINIDNEIFLKRHITIGAIKIFADIVNIKLSEID